MKRKSNSSDPRMLRPKTKLSLPERFAEQVLDNETELDLDCNIGTIVKLIELYSVIKNIGSCRIL